MNVMRMANGRGNDKNNEPTIDRAILPLEKTMIVYTVANTRSIFVIVVIV